MICHVGPEQMSSCLWSVPFITQCAESPVMLLVMCVFPTNYNLHTGYSDTPKQHTGLTQHITRVPANVQDGMQLQHTGYHMHRMHANWKSIVRTSTSFSFADHVFHPSCSCVFLTDHTNTRASHALNIYFPLQYPALFTRSRLPHRSKHRYSITSLPVPTEARASGIEFVMQPSRSAIMDSISFSARYFNPALN